MIEGIYLATLIGTVLVLIAAFSSLLAFRVGAPLLLVFLGIGLVAGVDGFGIAFDNASVAYFVGSLALAIILFDSGFGTSVQSLRQAAFPAIVLSTLGVVLTAAIFGAAARYLLGFTWTEAFLLGAIVGSTDAAAVFFLLRIGGIRIREKVRATLEIESGSNDPMAIFLTIVLVEIIANGTQLDQIGGTVVALFLLQMGIGVVAGLLGGMMIVGLVNRIRLERGLTPIFVLALSLLVFSVTGAVGGSGFLAAYVAGLYAGNRQMRAGAGIQALSGGMTWLALDPPCSRSSALPATAIAISARNRMSGRPSAGSDTHLIVARPLACVWLVLLPFGCPSAHEDRLHLLGHRPARRGFHPSGDPAAGWRP